MIREGKYSGNSFIYYYKWYELNKDNLSHGNGNMKFVVIRNFYSISDYTFKCLIAKLEYIGYEFVYKNNDLRKNETLLVLKKEESKVIVFDDDEYLFRYFSLSDITEVIYFIDALDIYDYFVNLDASISVNHYSILLEDLREKRIASKVINKPLTTSIQIPIVDYNDILYKKP